MKPGILLLAAVIAVANAIGCNGDDAANAVQRRTTPIDISDMGDLDAVALRLEDLVGVGDAEGVEGMWIEPNDFRGCRVGKSELPNDRLREFVPDRIQRFRTRAERTFSARWSGNLVYTRTWSGAPEILGGKLTGDACPADAFGKVWIYVRRQRNPRLIEHQFNLERVDGQWRVFFYAGRKASCKNPQWADGPMCNRLANSRP